MATKKSAHDEIIDMYLENRLKDYKEYKKLLSSEKQTRISNKGYDYKGCVTKIFCNIIIWQFLVLEKNVSLKYLRIFFEAEPFDKITKDSSAKFTDMLAAVGGTMGLLTGFSIISAVELLFFGLQIILNQLKTKKRRHFVV